MRRSSETIELFVRVRNAQGGYLFELILTVGAFRGGLQLDIGEDRSAAPGFLTVAGPVVSWPAESIESEIPVRRRTGRSGRILHLILC